MEKSSRNEGGDKTCRQCHTKFTLTVRKHSCKICSLNFCGKCSARFLHRPEVDKPGIHVRACDNCYTTYHTQSRTARVPENVEDAELAKAIQLSLEEENRRKRDHGNLQRQPKIEENATSSKFLTQPSIDPEELARATEMSLEDERLRLENSREYKRQLEMAQVISVLRPKSKSATSPPPQQQQWKGEETGEGKCMTCQHEKVTIVCRPCGHNVVRCECSKGLFGDGLLFCPTCGQEIQDNVAVQ